jgi:alcohol dehydrogenase
MTALFYSPSEIIMVDRIDHRLVAAKKLGATGLVNSTDGKAVETIMTMTLGRGVDVAIEAVGLPATFDICQSIIGVGGHIANVGVHGMSVPLHLERLWSQNITITTRLVDAISTRLLLKTVMVGKLDPKQLVTHRFPLNDLISAYETFSNAAKERALKVIISNY